jgi:hypothetical protein
MKQLMRLIATTLVLILFSVSPAQALFGSECKKPKSTYQQYLLSSKNLEVKEREAKKKVDIQTAAEFKRCLKNPKTFLREKGLNKKPYSKNSLGCEFWKISYGGYPLSIYSGGKSAYEEYKNAMLIVTSYKKCFDPSVYIEAVKWLKANPQ